jgi:hypothetical protein
LTHGVSTAAALASSTSSNAAAKKSKSKSDDSHNANAKSTSKAGNDSATTKDGAASSKTSLLDKAVRYLLDRDASPDRSAEDIWLMGVLLPGWGRDDKERVAAAAAEKAGAKTRPSTHRAGLHVPRGIRAHPRLAVPVLSASPTLLSERCAVFPLQVEWRVGAVNEDGGAACADADVAADTAFAVAEWLVLLVY